MCVETEINACILLLSSADTTLKKTPKETSLREFAITMHCSSCSLNKVGRIVKCVNSGYFKVAENAGTFKACDKIPYRYMLLKSPKVWLTYQPRALLRSTWPPPKPPDKMTSQQKEGCPKIEVKEKKTLKATAFHSSVACYSVNCPSTREKGPHLRRRL